MIKNLDRPIRVTNYNTYPVDIDFMEPMELSFGKVYGRPSGVVRLEMTEPNGSTTVGLGEGATLHQPVFTDDCGSNIANNSGEIISTFVDTEQTCEELVNQISNHEFNDGGQYPTARLAVEMALLDGYAKLHNRRVADYTGTERVVSVPFGKSIGANMASEMILQAKASLNKGARKIKFKVNPYNIKEVLSAVKQLRDTNPELEMMVDANGGFSVTDPEDIASIQLLDEAGLRMIEEPVSRVGEIRGLNSVQHLRKVLPELTTDICLDDCLTTFEDCKRALDNNLAEIINIKPGRIGSFVTSLELIDYSQTVGRQVMIGGMFEATPGRCMNVQLGAYCLQRGFDIAGDLSLAQDRLVGDLVSEARQLKLCADGTILMPIGKGWGFSGD